MQTGQEVWQVHELRLERLALFVFMEAKLVECEI